MEIIAISQIYATHIVKTLINVRISVGFSTFLLVLLVTLCTMSQQTLAVQVKSYLISASSFYSHVDDAIFFATLISCVFFSASPSPTTLMEELRRIESALLIPVGTDSVFPISSIGFAVYPNSGVIVERR